MAHRNYAADPHSRVIRLHLQHRLLIHSPTGTRHKSRLTPTSQARHTSTHTVAVYSLAIRLAAEPQTTGRQKSREITFDREDMAFFNGKRGLSGVLWWDFLFPTTKYSI